MKMATAALFLTVLAGLFTPSSSVFAICYAFQGGSCYDFSCPAGTDRLQQRIGLYSFQLCPLGQVCCKGVPSGPCSNHELCGTVLSGPNLAFGDDSTLRQFPWQAALRRINVSDLATKTLKNSFHTAGAAIIQDRWLLTDCLAAKFAGLLVPGDSYSENMIAVAGDNDLFNAEYYFGAQKEQVRRVRAVYQNPGFIYGPDQALLEILEHASRINDASVLHANNLCMVELEEPFEFNSFVRPVCIPDSLDCNADTECAASGWGTDEDRSLKSVLQHGFAEPYPRETCAELEYYRQNRSQPAAYYPENTSCAINTDGTFTCLGDYGGPFVCNNTATQKRVLHGILTFRTGPCHSNIMMTNVAPHKDWIWDTCKAAQI